MKKILVFPLVLVAVLAFLMVASVQAVEPATAPAVTAEKAPWDMPVVSIVFSPFEALWGMVSTPFAPSTKMWDRFNPFRWVGNGVGNGLQRMYQPIVGTERPFGENGSIAKSNIASNILGGLAIGTGWGALSHMWHMPGYLDWAHHTLGLHQRVALEALGATAGLVVGVTETVATGSDAPVPEKK